MEKISGLVLDEERALYNAHDVVIENCRFEGPADGESALKESHDIQVKDCRFLLRYPLWHVNRFELTDAKMTDTARAALWYSADGVISASDLGGIKCLRECSSVAIRDSRVNSAEFGWKCRDISIASSSVTSEYFMLDSSDLYLKDVNFTGKYSFQYTENVVIENCVLNTKDAFWHGRNVTVRNCTVKGEYLAWYSDGLTLENCHIIGTQPLCYCKNLRVINCTMEDTDLAFEYSDVEATVNGDILSVKNPKSGHILADSIGQVIWENSVVDCSCTVETRK